MVWVPAATPDTTAVIGTKTTRLFVELGRVKAEPTYLPPALSRWTSIPIKVPAVDEDPLPEAKITRVPPPLVKEPEPEANDIGPSVSMTLFARHMGELIFPLMFALPATSSAAAGFVTPMPTLPLPLMRMVSFKLVLEPVPNTISEPERSAWI